MPLYSVHAMCLFIFVIFPPFDSIYHRVDRFTVKCLLKSQTKHFLIINSIHLNAFCYYRRWLNRCYLRLLFAQLPLLLLLQAQARCTSEYFSRHLITFNRSIHCISIKFFAAFKKICCSCFYFVHDNASTNSFVFFHFVEQICF